MADTLVDSGAPIVLDHFGRQQLVWFDGEHATHAWAETRPFLTTTEPTRKQLAKHDMWTAGIWLTDDGDQLLYLTGHC